MKTTIVIYGSSTGSCQSIAETIASKLGVEAVDVANIDDATITSHENLLLGTSTWGAGEMQDDWYDGVKTLKSAGLAGKTVALFGCGDSESYPDTFCGGMKELYDAAVEAGATVLPGVSTNGYTYDDSEAIDGDKFLGLALDEVNEDDKTIDIEEAKKAASKKQNTSGDSSAGGDSSTDGEHTSGGSTTGGSTDGEGSDGDNVSL